MTVRILVSAHFLHLKISKIQNALSTQKIWIWSNERCLMLPWKRQAGSWVEKEKQNIWTNLSFKGGPWPGLADIIWHWWANISMLLLHLAFSNHTCHPSQLIQSNEREFGQWANKQFLKLFPAQTVLLLCKQIYWLPFPYYGAKLWKQVANEKVLHELSLQPRLAR